MSNRKRNTGINIRVTPEEKSRIERNAAKCRLTGRITENWKYALEINKSGNISNTRSNIRLILENDSELAGIVYNELADEIEITGNVPWKHHSRFWQDADDVQLICYMDEHYDSFSKGNLKTVTYSLSMADTRVSTLPLAK